MSGVAALREGGRYGCTGGIGESRFEGWGSSILPEIFECVSLGWWATSVPVPVGSPAGAAA